MIENASPLRTPRASRPPAISSTRRPASGQETSVQVPSPSARYGGRVELLDAAFRHSAPIVLSSAIGRKGNRREGSDNPPRIPSSHADDLERLDQLQPGHDP